MYYYYDTVIKSASINWFNQQTVGSVSTWMKLTLRSVIWQKSRAAEHKATALTFNNSCVITNWNSNNKSKIAFNKLLC